jgi:hypothetical protein
MFNSQMSFTVIYYAWKAKSGHPTTFGQTTPEYDSSMIEATTTASIGSGKY